MASSLPTRHLSNIKFDIRTLNTNWLSVAILFFVFFVALFEEYRKELVTVGLLFGGLLFAAYYFIVRCRVMFTLTPTHLQQHFFKGGWVLKWSNIQSIGLCEYGEQGWYKPLPWIGIKLKHYEPYLDGICPRIATEILLSQRALLYLGAKQFGKEQDFENIVLDSSTYSPSGKKRYKGLLAMLANRMKYQRAYHGYDIFISVNDLDRSGEEFVGLARRYLASAEPEFKPRCD